MRSHFDDLWTHSDLVVIQGEQDRTIGNGEPLFERRFDVELAGSDGAATTCTEGVLTLMVRGLAGSQPPAVRINEHRVGELVACTGTDPEHWFPETLPVRCGILREGQNQIEIAATAAEAFQIRSLICHYQSTRTG